ncbi:MAG: hypothetical protein ACOX15_10140 [Tepidanaerobacteraceae bacterium]
MSLSATYNPANVGPAFLEIFEKTKEAEKTSNKDIAIIGTAVALLLIAIGVKRSSVTPSSWPPLSGIGGMLTDWFFILDGIVILVICVFILVRTIRWAQGLKKAQAAKSVSVNKTEFK